MKLWNLILVLALTLMASHAEAAKRLGGGKSIGQQSSNVTKREAATQPAPASTNQNASGTAPAQSVPTSAVAGKPAAQSPTTPAPVTAPAPQAKKPWGAMLGGLAAGLGLAWLAHSLGFGAEFGQFLMIALLAILAMALVGWLIRSRKQQSSTVVRSPYAFQTASAEDAPPTPVTSSKPYNPANVGNDASARPWERQSMAFDASQVPASTQQGSMIGSALRQPDHSQGCQQGWGIPDGFDVTGFLDAAKQNFTTLQAAWDRGDISTLRSMMTDEMLGEIQHQLSERENASQGSVNSTEVLMLNAQLLGIEELQGHYMASVEFSGMIREDVAVGPAPFREVWNMTKAKDGSNGWLVAGLQALQ